MKASGVKVPLEIYLKRATRGLPRRARAEAQAELRSHVHERAHELRQSGSSPEAAELRAVQELGEARTVARSLQRSHHVHPVLSAIAMVALVGFFGLGLQKYMTVERIASFERLSQRVVIINAKDDLGLASNTQPRADRGVFLKSEVADVLKDSKVKFLGSGEKARLELAGYPTIFTQRNRILNYQELKGYRLGKPLYDMNLILDEMIRKNWPLKITGWGDETRLSIGGDILQDCSSPACVYILPRSLQYYFSRQIYFAMKDLHRLKRPAESGYFNRFYWELPQNVFYDQNTFSFSSNEVRKYTLKTKVMPSKVYALISYTYDVNHYEPWKGKQNIFNVSVGTADVQGILNFQPVSYFQPARTLRPLQFVSNIKRLDVDVPGKTDPTVLIELSRDLGTTAPAKVVQIHDLVVPTRLN